tara:strand:+ start:28 stop:648 length:621 start_codon:yes stop_codon:yes gene_type:complete
MNRKTKIIIFSIILVFAIIQKQGKEDSVSTKTTSTQPKEKKPDLTEFDQYKRDDPKVDPNKYYPTPKNGFSPYNAYFGKGIYNNSLNNSFKIKNSNTTDAVVLLVNAYSKRKVRNEFVRKGATFEMTGVPNGTYYLEWFSGNDWSPDLKVGSNYKGGFRSKASFTKTKDVSDWMKVSGNQIWTVTLYTVAGGDVESESMNANEFFD